MSPSSNPDQDQNLENTAIQESQVQLGQAGGDSIQIVGSNNQVVVHPSRSQALSQEQPLNRQEYRNRQILLNKVRNFWVKGVLEKSLYNKARIELGLEERFDTLELLYETPEQLRQALPSGTKAIDKFDELREGRTLLILGHPGGGKTTTLLELARDLVQRSEQNTMLPMPIVFNLSSWTDKNQKIADWLVQELNSKYQVSKKTSRTWLQDQQLLLLLDGLDEVKENLRDACVQAINQFSQEHGQTEIVVCSRIKDYEVLSQRFRFQGAIFIQPLTFDQIMNYLDQAGAELAGVKAALQTNIALQDLAESPLMLSIMALAYQGILASELTQMTEEEQQKHLFDRYIQKMLDRRMGKQPYSKEQAKRWLIWLSQRMMQDCQAIFLIERMQPTCLQTKIQRWRYRVGIGTISGLAWIIPDIVVNLIIGCFVVISQPFSSTILIQILAAMSGRFVWIPVYGLTFYLIVALRNQGKIKPIETLKWSWKKAWEGFILWSRNSLLTGLIPGLFLGLILSVWCFWVPFSELKKTYVKEDHWLHILYNLPDTFISRMIYGTVCLLLMGLLGAFFGLLFAITWGPTGALVQGLVGPSIARSVFPNQGIRLSAINAGITALISGIAGGLISGLITIFFVVPYYGLLIGLKAGLIFGGIGLFLWARTVAVVVGMACIQHFTLRLILHHKSIIPWNYARFLDWACDRLFLQRVGGGYIFVHRLLLEHFAQMGTEAEKTLQND